MDKKIKRKKKIITKKKNKPSKEEKDIVQFEVGEKKKFIDNVIRNGGSVREITDPFGR